MTGQEQAWNWNKHLRPHEISRPWRSTIPDFGLSQSLTGGLGGAAGCSPECSLFLVSLRTSALSACDLGVLRVCSLGRIKRGLPICAVMGKPSCVLGLCEAAYCCHTPFCNTQSSKSSLMINNFQCDLWFVIGIFLIRRDLDIAWSSLRVKILATSNGPKDPGGRS